VWLMGRTEALCIDLARTQGSIVREGREGEKRTRKDQSHPTHHSSLRQAGVEFQQDRGGSGDGVAWSLLSEGSLQ
jgi:hypothetical protein